MLQASILAVATDAEGMVEAVAAMAQKKGLPQEAAGAEMAVAVRAMGEMVAAEARVVAEAVEVVKAPPQLPARTLRLH